MRDVPPEGRNAWNTIILPGPQESHPHSCLMQAVDRLRPAWSRFGPKPVTPGRNGFRAMRVVYDPRRPWTATVKDRPITGASVKARMQAWFQVSCSYQW